MLCPKLHHKTGIYQIRQESTGKRYIGSSVRLRKRCWTHAYELNRGLHHCDHLQRSWSKRKGKGFVFEVLLYCDPKDAVAYEQALIDALRPEYNTSPTAGSCLGHKQTDEHRAKIRAAHLGSKRTDETRARMSAAQKGRKPTEVVREANRAYWANPANSRVGVPLSPEHREAIRQGSKKKVLTPEHLAKLEAARRAKATLTHDQVREVRKMSAGGLSRRDIAKVLSVSHSCIGDILRGDTYRYVND